MIQFLGEDRIFDKAIQESNTSTATSRVIELYGVNSLEELDSVPLIVQSSVVGVEAASTVTITNDGTTIDSADLLVFDGTSFDTPTANWVIIDQLYVLVYSYNNDEFRAYPLGSSSDSGSSESTIFIVSSDILSLTSSSSSSDIQTAFGSAAIEASFIDWIDSMNGTIIILDTSYSTVDFKQVLNYSITNNNLDYNIFFQEFDSSNSSITYKTLTFSKTSASDTVFSSVTVTSLTISNGNGVAY